MRLFGAFSDIGVPFAPGHFDACRAQGPDATGQVSSRIRSRVRAKGLTGVVHGDYFVTFCHAGDLKQALGESITIKESLSRTPDSFLRYGARLLPAKQALDVLVQLLQQAWDGFPRIASMPRYPLANKREAVFFTLDHVGLSRVRIPGNRRGGRQLVGQWHSRWGGERNKHYWHFGIEVKPFVHPFFGYMVKPHVVFSDDGKTPWENTRRAHSARRSQCRDWWNPAWRDRIHAALAWLAQPDTVLRIRVSSDSSIGVSLRSVEFVSPLYFRTPKENAPVAREEAQFEDDESEVEFEDEVPDDMGS